ncbi:MAG: oxidoreductase domain protein [Paenibacillus sp.]|nr:oxidoreductase domain protein [Paenibacillus sp.]
MTIKVGIAGVRGLSALMGFRSIPDVEVTAFCDLNEDLLNATAEKYGIANKYRLFEDMIQSDIDAVVISTPMQHHVRQSIEALYAGKHVLCEVTAGVSMEELWWLIETVEKSGRTYMMAENNCYLPENRIIGEMIRRGMFGDIYYGEGEYIHELKKRTLYPDGTPNWRSFWQYGRRGSFYPTHSIGPLMKWFEGDRIRSVITCGTGWHTAPQFRQEDTAVTLCQLESGKLLKLRVDCISERPHNPAYYSLQGTKGCYEAPRGMGDDHKLWLNHMDPDTDSAKWRPLHMYADLLPERYKTATDEQKNAGHRGSDFFLIHDFVDAVRTGGRPPVDVYEACEWTAVGLLSELSVMNGGRPAEMPNFRKNMPMSEKITKML